MLGDELLGALDASYCHEEGVPGRVFRCNFSCPVSRHLYLVVLKDCGDAPRANVLSISYSSSPDVSDQGVLSMLQRMCTEIGKVRATPRSWHEQFAEIHGIG